MGAGRKAFQKYFGTADRGDVDLAPRYNIAPTQDVPTIRQDAHEPVRELTLMRWGLVPYWAKDASVGYKLINARSETITLKGGTPPYAMPAASRAKERRAPRIRFFI